MGNPQVNIRVDDTTGKVVCRFVANDPSTPFS